LAAPTSFEQSEIRELVHSLKYDGLKPITQEMATLINQSLGKNILKLLNPEKTFIIPIPLHPIKLKQRGFNQSEQLAREIAQKLGKGWRVKNILIRKINNKSQTECLNKKERIENVRGIFTVKQKLEGQDLIVVDDVFTSGATMREVIKTLKSAGAGRVVALTFAEA
jgi:ComF family protein